jgi:hypothetical protein
MTMCYGGCKCRRCTHPETDALNTEINKLKRELYEHTDVKLLADLKEARACITELRAQLSEAYTKLSPDWQSAPVLRTDEGVTTIEWDQRARGAFVSRPLVVQFVAQANELAQLRRGHEQACQQLARLRVSLDQFRHVALSAADHLMDDCGSMCTDSREWRGRQ